MDKTTGLPVEDAVVMLVDGSGASRAGARTDSAGFWSLRDRGQRGWFSIRVQKDWYEPIETDSFLVGDEPVSIRLIIQPKVASLEGVVVEGISLAARQRRAYEAFLSRRDRRMGFGLGPDEIAARIARLKPKDTAALVGRVIAGMEINPRDGGLLFPPRRAGASGCSPIIVVDGERYDPPEFPGTPPWDVNQLVALWELRGVEVYTDPLLIPSELGLKYTAWEPCGVILLWTYRGIGKF